MADFSVITDLTQTLVTSGLILAIAYAAVGFLKKAMEAIDTLLNNS